jgi:hypothetical protein
MHHGAHPVDGLCNRGGIGNIALHHLDTHLALQTPKIAHWQVENAHRMSRLPTALHQQASNAAGASGD